MLSKGDQDRILVLAKVQLYSQLHLWVMPKHKPIWMDKGDIWVNLLGIPVHLWSFDMFHELCFPFGKLNMVKDTMGNQVVVSVVQVMLEDCDLLEIPYLISLCHYGVSYPFWAIHS